MKPIICLGIESSCDETSAAVVDSDRNILSHVIYSQIPQHQKFGGVVPELAARAHILAFEEVVRRALSDAGKTIDDIDVIAATAGPGLIGGVIVGWLGAVGIAQGTGKPLVAVNHLEGHALVPRLCSTDSVGAENLPPLQFPYLLLLASGGHTQILLVRGVGNYEIIGQTLDDSAGECYDKVAKMLGLGYPGGPLVDSHAAKGDATRFKFPRPLCDKPGCDFSFSGLKTAARTILDAQRPKECGVWSVEYGINDENINAAKADATTPHSTLYRRFLCVVPAGCC
jgi:N6-L-threonylcarbamoyladenine synthase